IAAGTEICGNGKDDNCNRLVDCNDPACAVDGGCGSGFGLPNGAACTFSAQCLGGFCRTEASTGAPNGYCTNTGSCTRDSNGVSTGCSANSTCAEDEAGNFTFCQLSCSGATGCRSGQA